MAALGTRIRNTDHAFTSGCLLLQVVRAAGGPFHDVSHQGSTAGTDTMHCVLGGL